MKTSHAPHLTTLIGLAAFFLAAGSSPAADNPASQNPPPSAPSAPSKNGDAAKEDTNETTATATWATIKDFAYVNRADVITGLAYMVKKLDAGMLTLGAKRAGMTDAAAKEWDFNLKELNDARAYLQSMGSKLEKATESTWDEAKARIDEAWQRVRNAYAKVKNSTTS